MSVSNEVVGRRCRCMQLQFISDLLAVIISVCDNIGGEKVVCIFAIFIDSERLLTVSCFTIGICDIRPF